MLRDLKKLPLFKNLSEKEMVQVGKAAVERHYPKGMTILVEGEESDGLYIVVSGLIKVIKIHEDGREKTLDLIKDGDVLGEMTIVGSSLRSATAITVKQTSVIAFPRKSFQRLMVDIPELAANVIEILSERLRNANAQIEALTFMNARSRVLSSLIHMAGGTRGSDEGKPVFVTRLSQAEMANLCGVSRQAVNRVFTELRKDGFIEILRKQIRISDIGGLKRLLMDQ